MDELLLKDVISLIPERAPDAHKGDFGTLLSVCGSANYRGAAALSAEAALRSGVGILRLASTEKVCAAVAASLPEVTFIPQEEGETGGISGFSASRIFEKYRGITAVLCGCGLTVTDGTRAAVLDLIENADCTLVLDADALNCIKDDPDVLRRARRAPILTPHWGEFARLIHADAAAVASDPEKLALAFAARTRSVVALKSHFTVVAAPHGSVCVSRAGNAGLARGGSGDLLAGMIAGFAAEGLDAYDAARLGVALHGASADRCAARLGMTGMLPRDIIDDMIQIMKERK